MTIIGDINMQNFGYKHLLGLFWLFAIIFIALVILLRIRKLKKKGLSYDLWVIKGATIFIWAWEFIKTVYMIRSESFGGVGNYPAFMLPLHICSMALYTYLIIGFFPGKLADFIKPFGFATMLVVTSIILIIPYSSGILGNLNHWQFVPENIMPFQSFLYHGTLVFVPLYMVLSGFYQPKLKDVWKAMTTLAVTAVFATIMNKLLLTTDFMTLERGIGNPFQYLVADNYFLYILILTSITTVAMVVVLGLSELILLIKNQSVRNKEQLKTSI
jgi:hypothetical protein